MHNWKINFEYFKGSLAEQLPFLASRTLVGARHPSGTLHHGVNNNIAMGHGTLELRRNNIRLICDLNYIHNCQIRRILFHCSFQNGFLAKCD